MALKYRWGKIGKSHWFKCFPFVIVAINILIAVVSDFESAIRAWGTTWVSSEGVTLYGGWHNVFNGVAGLINIACMTGWFGIYVSKKKQDLSLIHISSSAPSCYSPPFISLATAKVPHRYPPQNARLTSPRSDPRMGSPM